MLLIKMPRQKDLQKIIRALLANEISREEVLSWQRGVVSSCGWEIPIGKLQGYWYLYSLMYIAVRFPGGYFLRESDLEEYLRDLEVERGGEIQPGLGHLRSHEINLEELRWPIAVMTDHHDVMASLPSVRGAFEKRMDMVEHCHLRFDKANYLLVKQFDEQTGQVLLLGGNRDKPRARQLLGLLGVTDYMLP